MKLGSRLQIGPKKFHIWLGAPKNGPNNAKKTGCETNKFKKKNQILYDGWIFFPNHRIDMQVGVGLHMSHARQNLGTLGGFKTPPTLKKNLGGGAKKGI